MEQPLGPLGVITSYSIHYTKLYDQERFLPEIGDYQRTRRIATRAISRRRSGGSYHLAPALSPDGREVAFFSERSDSYNFV